MASRVYIPIDKSSSGRQKAKHDAIERLQKERYSTPIYEIGQITDLVYRSDDPLNTTDIERKIIVQQHSFDEARRVGLAPSDTETSFNQGHESIVSYTIGVRKDSNGLNTFKVGDIVEIEIVSNEITKRNNIDGFYRSTLQNTENFWNYVEGKAYPIIDTFKGAQNTLSKTFFPDDSSEPEDLNEEVLNTKKEVPAYKGGRFIGNIEVVTLEGKEVEINTAKKYLEMKKAAKREKVYLGITSGYRSMESQIRIYNSRYEPDYKGTGTCSNKGENTSGTFERATKVAEDKGVAAYPGCSNHQNGKALDLWNSSRNVAWLRANASRFGFFNTVRSENWHWEYLG